MMDWFKQNGITLATWLAVAAGVGLRLRQYLTIRSLWFDEALLAVNIVRRSFAQLAEPLDYFQGAPVLFLWIEKLVTTLFGNGELSLRLFPLLAGILALVLFPLLAARYQPPRAVLWGVILFAFADPLIYYASEVKQYSVDVFAAVLSLALFLALLRGSERWLAALGLGAAGIALIWLSHPAIFTLAAAGLIVFAVRARERDRSHLLRVTVVGLIWLAGFAANYLLTLDTLGRDEVLLNFWRSGFPPLESDLAVYAIWTRERLLGLFSGTLNLLFSGLALLFYGLGLLWIARRDVPRALSLILPLLLAFTAALLGRYPFIDRLILFLCPMVFIAIGEGLDRLLAWPADRRWLRAAGALLLAVFLLPQISSGLVYATNPEYGEQIRPVIRQLYESREADDPVYLYFAARVPFAYYQAWYPIPDEMVISGTRTPQDRDAFRRELAEVVGDRQRLWLVFTHITSGANGSDEAIILDVLAELGGQQQVAINEKEASAYLFTFPRQPR